MLTKTDKYIKMKWDFCIFRKQYFSKKSWKPLATEKNNSISVLLSFKSVRLRALIIQKMSDFYKRMSNTDKNKI